MSRSRLSNFLNDVKKEYEKARFVYKDKEMKKKTTHVHRGRSRIVASITEDLFAKYLCREFKNVYIFVDQCITLEGKKKVSYYPDLVICKKKNKKKHSFEILYMIDLKMDIGWIGSKYTNHMKKVKTICEKMKKVKFLKGKKGDIECGKKEKIEFCINKKACYDVVIVSSKNSRKYESDLIKDSNNKTTNIWVLSTGDHPNHYGEKIKVKPNEDDYNILIEKILKVINHAK